MDVNPQELLDRQRVGLLVAHHRYVVQPVEIGEALTESRANEEELRKLNQTSEEFRCGCVCGCVCECVCECVC